MSALKQFSARHPAGVRNGDILRGALATARDFAREDGLPRAMAERLAIVVEELVENALTHGACSPEIRIGMRLWREGESVALVLEDNGRAFDPREAPEAEAPREDRGGGVGLSLVRAWARIRAYDRIGDDNRLELVLRPPAPPTGESNRG